MLRKFLSLCPHIRPVPAQRTMAPKQFTMQRQVIIKGGYTDKAVHLQTEGIDGDEFVELRQGHHYKFFAAMGGVDKQSQGKTRQLFDYLKAARTREVDRLLRAALKSEDPMAEEIDQSVMDDVVDRKAIFMKHDIANTCVIKVDQFKINNEVQPTFDLKMRTSPCKLAALSVECTCEVFDWLCKALNADEAVWLTPHAPRKRKLEDLPEVDFPLRYGLTKNGGILLWARVKNADGKWARYQKQIDEMLEKMSDGTESGNADAMAKICESFSRDIEAKRNSTGSGHDEDDQKQDEELAVVGGGEDHDEADDDDDDDDDDDAADA